MSGLAEMDVLKSQLKTGDMEMPTMPISVEYSGVINANRERKRNEDENCKPNKRCYCDVVEAQEGNFQHAKFNKKCTQGTQTESFTSSAM